MLELDITEPMPNPFTYGKPVSDPTRFVGREEELQQIFSRLGTSSFESSSIVGEGRLGKTSLLNHISHPDTIRRYGLEPDT